MKNNKNRRFALIPLLLTFSLSGSGCSPAENETQTADPEGATGTVVDDAAMSDTGLGENWLAFGRNYREQRHSTLTNINASNVGELGVDWYLDLPRERGLVSTPLVVDGTLYFVGSMNRVRAVNGANGELLWEFDPQVAVNAGNGLRAGREHNRGIGIWKDKVYAATWDGRLIAIDRANGTQVWSVRTFGAEEPMYITGAPKIFKGKVLVGNGGAESGGPARGYVTAYDAETGEQTWRFYIVPGNPADGFENEAMRMAAETWTGEWWRHGGGGNAWHGFTYDAELDQLYIGTGNGAPWNQRIRSPGGGDNLFLCSVVALDPDTGDYLWHYQTTPGETWDFNSNMDIVLADLAIDGRDIKALMHAPKNGFFYVIDRSNGELISADAFTEVTWASHVDMVTGRPVEVAGARYGEGPARVSPTPWGAHSWHAMSYNPGTGLAYIPAMHLAATYSDEGVVYDDFNSTPFGEGEGDTGPTGVHWLMDDVSERNRSSLQAWDPVNGEIAWEVELPGTWNAGTMTTAGNLVFQGRVSGEFVAYDASNGDILWTIDLGLGISAPPITYAINGKQYVSVLVGWGGGGAAIGTRVEINHGWAYGLQQRRLVTFSLTGDQTLPAQPAPMVPEPLIMAEFEVDTQLAERGARQSGRCMGCHGFWFVSSGVAPDLRASPVVASAEAFADIVRGGSLMENGMPRYAHLTDDQLLTIRHYVRLQAELATE